MAATCSANPTTVGINQTTVVSFTGLPTKTALLETITNPAGEPTDSHLGKIAVGHLEQWQARSTAGTWKVDLYTDNAKHTHLCGCSYEVTA